MENTNYCYCMKLIINLCSTKEVTLFQFGHMVQRQLIMWKLKSIKIFKLLLFRAWLRDPICKPWRTESRVDGYNEGNRLTLVRSLPSISSLNWKQSVWPGLLIWLMTKCWSERKTGPYAMLFDTSCLLWNPRCDKESVHQESYVAESSKFLPVRHSTVIFEESQEVTVFVVIHHLKFSQVLPFISLLMHIVLLRELFTLSSDTPCLIRYVLWIICILSFIGMAIGIYLSDCFH